VQTFAHHMNRPQGPAAPWRRLSNDSHRRLRSHTGKSNFPAADCQPAHFDFSGIRIQPNLTMSQPGDLHEQEAERVAAAVMGGSKVALSAAASSASSMADVHRYASDKSGSLTAPHDIYGALRSPSQPLDPDARRFMEAGFGHDFGHVRIHADSKAASASQSAGAQAFTFGPDIVFGAGQYQPGSRRGRQLIAHELTHVLQNRGGELVVRRSVLYPNATVTRNDDPILRYMSGDDALALTTLTINGAAQITAGVLRDAFGPKEIEPKAAPAVPSQSSGSGSGSGSASGSGSGVRAGQGSGSGSGSGGGSPSGSGSGSGATQIGQGSGSGPAAGGGSGSGSGGGSTPVQCGFKDFDLKISANIRLPRPPADGRWGPEEMERRNIRRARMPPECGQKDQISIVMRGEPDSDNFYQWMTANEQEHANDIKNASDQLLVPDHQAVLALRATGVDSNACTADLNNQLNRLSTDNVQHFLQKVRADVVGRDVPGGHKFDSKLEQRNDCANLSILLKKTPAPPAGGHR
jgi:hypothetical protein